MRNFFIEGKTINTITNHRAIFLMVLAAVSGTAMQTAVRIAAESMHPFEILFFRNVLGIIFLVPFFIHHGIRILRTTHTGLHLIRGGFQVAAMSLNWLALTMIPLADVQALLFTAPLFTGLGAIIFLGEKSYLRRWIAIGFGFAGMLIIVRPGFSAFDVGMALVLCGAIMLSATRLIVKKVSKEDTAPTIVALMTIIITPISLVPALFVWTWPDLEVLAMLVLIAGLGTLTHLLMSQAIRDGDLTQIEPVMFTRLIWAGLFGYILFAEIPTLWTWIGAAVIVVSTTALVRSEARRKASELPLE